MKKLAVTIAFALFFCSFAAAQANGKIAGVEKTPENAFRLLELMDMRAFNFDLSGLGGGDTMAVYIDEKSDSGVRRVRRFVVGPVTDVDFLSVYIVPRQDSQVGFTFDVKDMGSFTFGQKLYPAQNAKTPQYAAVAYDLSKATESRTDIPLILYASYWWDGDFGAHRFCFEDGCINIDVLDADTPESDLAIIPHYYVVGIELQKTE